MEASDVCSVLESVFKFKVEIICFHVINFAEKK